ncbi:MAG: hypothetical protein AAF558_03060 [Verrucomicrobiota bacterium]
MPNGKPGDHPYSDIFIHHSKIFGDEIDSLIRELNETPHFEKYKKEVSKLLAKHEPVFDRKPNIPQLKQRLFEIKKELTS